jgi:N-methylhydantoinase A
MATAIRSRTIQKGHDPREFSLVAFGGAGPLHAAEVARSLGIPEVIVPVYPGLTSALGLLSSDLKYDLIRNEFMLDGDADLGKLAADFADLDAEARAQLERDGVPAGEVDLIHAADCRYVGQGYELRVRMAAGAVDEAAIAGLWRDFHRLHEDEYGRSFPANPIELVNIRVVAVGPMPKVPPFKGVREGSVEDALVDAQDVFYRGESRVEGHETRFYERDRLPVGATVEGSAVLLQPDSTVIVPPGASAEVLETGDVLLRI